MNPGPHGILLIDKPPGWTSHDVVAKARRLCSQKKIGHTGTLDPMATGLLVLCLGDATRLVEYMTGHDKRYTGEIRLGARTDTDDAEGTVIEERPVPPLEAAQLQGLANQFTGSLLQRPPAYSAIQVAGQRAYEAARRGNAVDLPLRPVTVHRLSLEQTAPDRLAIAVDCGAGTYIRSLARDIGETLGCGGHLSRLRRTVAGAFHVEDAIGLSELEAACQEDRLDDLLWAPDEGMLNAPAALLAAPSRADFVHGRSFETAPAVGFEERIRVYDASGIFLGVGRFDAELGFRAEKVFASAQI